MKVLYIINSLEGYGAERSVVELALSFNNVKSVFIQLYTGDELIPQLKAVGINIYQLNLTPKSGNKTAVEKVINILHQEKPDIIHSTLFKSDMVAREIRARFGEWPLVGSFVSNSYSCRRYSLLNGLSKIKLFSTQLRDRRNIHRVDRFISNSKTIKESNSRALGVSEDKIDVIYRGRNFENYRLLRKEVEEVRSALDLGGRKVFLNIGRLQKSKGQSDLIKAFKKFVEKFPDTVLLLVGSGLEYEDLKEEIKMLGLVKDALLLGYRNDVQHLLHIADFFVFPSYYEGLPGSLIEAIITKKPCIVSDIPEIRECFSDDGALYFHPGDVGEITKKMEEAVRFKHWDARVERNFSFAQENFDIEVVSRKYENFYRQLLYEKSILSK